jgi:hypothetical protein
MRVLHAAALAAAALLLASVTSAQGLGDAAARERQKRKAAPDKPVKVYTEGDVGRSMAPVSSAPELPATAEQAAAEGQPPAEGQPAAEGKEPAEGGAPAADTAAQKAADEERERAQAAWRQQLDQARRQEAGYKEIIDRTQLQLNDLSGMYSPSRAQAIAYLDESKQKLAEVQGRIVALEDEGRRNNYR